MTDRQRTVLLLIADGFTDAETAAQLGVSTETVIQHVKNLRRRLGAKTRAQAVAIALRGGMIE